MRLFTCLAVAAGILSFSARVQAVPINIVNYSFEADVVPTDNNPATVSNGDDTIGITPVGWSNNVGGLLTRKPGSFFNNLIAPTPDPADGPNEQMAWSNGGSYEYQVLTATLAPNTLYTLQVDIGVRSDTSFPGADIRFGTGSTMGANLLTAATSNTAAPASGNWSTWAYTFVTTPLSPNLGQTLRIEFHSNGIQTSFDNFRLDAVAVPEPSTLMLLTLGGLIAFAAKRR
jgi:hypothetical protein